MADKIPEHMEHTPRVFVPKPTQLTVCATGVKGEYGFQMGRLLFGNCKLLRSKTGYPYHADVPVTPGLFGYPLDKVITVPDTGTPIL